MIALSKDQAAALRETLEPLFQYAETSPSIECGEGYWEDMESACSDGERQEQSRAAAIMRHVIAALGFQPPSGLTVCPDCYREPEDGHAFECEHAAEEEEDDDTCTACGRESLDCSRNPCPAVIADREA